MLADEAGDLRALAAAGDAAARRLRDALGDSAESPRFIETLPRRGYRFIGMIEDAA